MPKEPQQPAAMRALLDVKERQKPYLKGFPNVTGVGVGYREVGGARTDELCIRVYVSKKLPREALKSEEVLPSRVDGMRVDVIEAVFEAQLDHRLRYNPLQGGISVGNLLLGGSGTLGVSVYDEDTGEDMLLSNWHVLCGRFDCASGETVIQPGTGGGDTGTAADVVARLYRWALTDEVDGAIARLTGHRFLLKENLELGPVSRTAPPVLGAHVRKSGRTTAVTEGTIADISADVSVRGYPGGTREFLNQLSIEGEPSVSAPGDSGSVWLDDSHAVVGLNFAGSGDGKRATANPIFAVMQALRINFDRGITMHSFVAITSALLH